MEATLRDALESGKVDILKNKRWSDDTTPVITRDGEHVMDINTCGMDMFGMVHTTVHLTAWIVNADGGVSLWVPKCVKGGEKYKSLLDSAVSGTIGSRELPIEGILRRCEEDGLYLKSPDVIPNYIRDNICHVGSNSFQMKWTDDREWPAFHHQVQFLFEIELREEFLPAFWRNWTGRKLGLMSVGELMEAWKHRRVKPSSTLRYIAWLIRGGYLDSDNEPDLVEISTHISRRQDLFEA